MLAPASIASLIAGTGPSNGQKAATIRPARVGVPVFSGTGFQPGSRVTITLVNGARRHVRTVRASRHGAFAVRFAFVAIDPCRGTLSVTAVDRLGTRARWSRECRPPSITDPYPA